MASYCSTIDSQRLEQGNRNKLLILQECGLSSKPRRKMSAVFHEEYLEELAAAEGNDQITTLLC